MSNLSRPLWSSTATLLVALGALSVSACGTEVIYANGEGGTANSGGNTGGNTGGNNTGGNTGGNNTGGNTGGNNTGGNNTGGNNTGGGSGVDCVNANNGDPCGSPGSYCSYYDAGINEYCDGWCDDSFRWQKSCYTQPTYCYQPAFCPSSPPVNGTYCPSTDDCEYYDCEFVGACGGSGYGQASCQDNVWYTYNDCYCYQPPNLCPSTPPANGSPCTTTQQCQNYDCEWVNACGNNTYHYAYCDQNGTWYSDGECN